MRHDLWVPWQHRGPRSTRQASRIIKISDSSLGENNFSSLVIFLYRNGRERVLWYVLCREEACAFVYSSFKKNVVLQEHIQQPFAMVDSAKILTYDLTKFNDQHSPAVVRNGHMDNFQMHTTVKNITVKLPFIYR